MVKFNYIEFIRSEFLWILIECLEHFDHFMSPAFRVCCVFAGHNHSHVCMNTKTPQFKDHKKRNNSSPFIEVQFKIRFLH